MRAGVLDARIDALNIQATKGVFVATGGASSNCALRMVFDSRMCDVYQVGGEPYSYQTGDGILLSQKIGAALFAMGNQTSGSATSDARWWRPCSRSRSSSTCSWRCRSPTRCCGAGRCGEGRGTASERHAPQ